MPGPTLCGELSDWAGDASLLNCCVDDHNEPLDNGLNARMRVHADRQWIDLNDNSVSAAEAAIYSIDEEGRPGSTDGDDVDDGDMGIEPMSLRHPYIRQYTGTNGDGPDHMARLLEACPHEPYEQVAVGSCSRLPLRRSTRYSRAL